MTTTIPESAAPLLLGRYRPHSLIGRGGMASIFRAHDETLDRDVALKLFRAGGAEDMDQHHTELSALARLSHHGIVSLIDAGIDYSSPEDPRPFLVMELVRGTDLETTLGQRALTAEEIAEIAFDLAEALEYVHANGVIHHDIKPSNVMLVEYGTSTFRARARLADFGIALNVADDNTDTGQETTGTAAYLSPEQASRQPVSTASDVYSLGLVLLQSFTRTIAFPGNQVQSALARLDADPAIPADLPGDWTALLTAMTARDPDARPAMADLTLAFRQAIFDATT
ncbi:serine/threonine-protein kinase [Leifsonia sp. NPDC058292]|uniref:serine/threonine-protein kinase n=1 Tax=Leifsonia sp. NPDC058292 TaxID=3346428 RepID=UPI0036DD6070